MTPTDPLDPDSATWTHVHEVFHEALGLAPDAREAWLATLASTEPALVREVRSLIAAHEASSDFLAQSPALPSSPTVSPGDRFGAYRVVSEIGHGGMGVVYRAIRDDGDFNREVAIKLIDPGLQSENLLKRFRAERQILALLDHPNIVRLLDGGTAPDGRPYLVMEYVSGTSLTDYCDRRRLGIDARIELFLHVCDAVQFAHQRLVVHRDLKSDNVLVTDDGSARLLDFGIAKLLAPDGGTASATLTAPMHRMLTPEYASPEQVRGEPAAVASDVYSLGVILYELLSGTRPLRFETRTPEEILRVVTQVDPIPPSTAVTRSRSDDIATVRGETTARLRRRLSGDLDYIVLRAIEKDPARRYGSVDQFAQDLRRYREGLPVLARGASQTYRLSRFVRRHRAAVITGSLVAVALVAGLAATTWQASVARHERDRAKRRFNDVRELAHAVVFDLHDAIANLPGSTRAREILVRHALRYLDRLNDEASGDLALQRELGVAYGKIGDVQGRPMFPNLGESNEAHASYVKAIDLLRTVATAWPDSVLVAHDLALTMQRMADLLNTMGKPREAMALALEAKQKIQFEIARHPDEPVLKGDLGVACDRLFDMRLAAGDTAGALDESRQGLALIEPAFVANPRDPGTRRAVMISYSKTGNLFAAQGVEDSALACFERAGALAREAVLALPNDTDALRDLSIVYGMHGLMLADQGNLDSALAVYGRGMRISEDLAAKDPDNVLQQTDVAQGHFEIGTMLMNGHRYEPAERRFEEAFRRFSSLSAKDPGNASLRTWSTDCTRSAGAACEALAARANSASERSRWSGRAAEWRARARQAGSGSAPDSSR